MTFNSSINTLLDSTMEAITSVIPLKTVIETPVLKNPSSSYQCFGVQITITGDFTGKMLIESDKDVFSKLGMSMFGMPLPDEMLASFAGEIGNMIAGNLSTNCSRKAFIIDISTPTVFENAPVYSAFAHVVSLPVELHETGRLSIILAAEQ